MTEKPCYPSNTEGRTSLIVFHLLKLNPFFFCSFINPLVWLRDLIFPATQQTEDFPSSSHSTEIFTSPFSVAAPSVPCYCYTRETFFQQHTRQNIFHPVLNPLKLSHHLFLLQLSVPCYCHTRETSSQQHIRQISHPVLNPLKTFTSSYSSVAPISPMLLLHKRNIFPEAHQTEHFPSNSQSTETFTSAFFPCNSIRPMLCYSREMFS